MANKNMDLTAGYNADVARVYGVTEALLLDAISFWSRNSRRQDGFCWFTAEEFEANTAIKRGAMARAVKNLLEKGIIEVKNTYIVGTQKKCRHFKIVGDIQSQASEVMQSDCTETIQSGSTETIQSLYSSNRTLTERESKDSGAKASKEDIEKISVLYYKVIKELELTNSNNTVTRKKIKQLANEISVEQAIWYLQFLLHHYEEWDDQFKPELYEALHIYSKRKAIIDKLKAGDR